MIYLHGNNSLEVLIEEKINFDSMGHNIAWEW